MSEKKYFVDINLQGNEVVKLKADTLDITSNAANANAKRIVYWSGDYYYSDGTDWVQMSGGGGGSVTSVTATSPLSSTGGATPDISISQANSTTNGYLTSTDWQTFNGKQNSLISGGNLILNNPNNVDDFIKLQFNGTDTLSLKSPYSGDDSVASLTYTKPTRSGQTTSSVGIKIDTGTTNWDDLAILPNVQKEIEITSPTYGYDSAPSPMLPSGGLYYTLYINSPGIDYGTYGIGINGNIRLDEPSGAPFADSNLDIGNGTHGSIIGLTTAKKIAFYGATPIVQPAAVTTVQGIANALTSLGLLASSSIGSPTPNVQTVISAATVTPTSANDEVVITDQHVALTLANPTGTPSQGQALTIRIKDDGTSRTIAYDTQYRAVGVTLPTNTTVSKTLYLGLIYNSTDTKWDVVGVSLEGSDPFTGNDWIDYSATSTIVGWSSFTTKIIKYRIIGKQLFCIYNFNGTSNSTSVTFTLPNSVVNSNLRAFGLSVDNAIAIGTSLISQNAGSNVINVYKDSIATSWTSSGSKLAYGQFFYEIA